MAELDKANSAPAPSQASSIGAMLASGPGVGMFVLAIATVIGSMALGPIDASIADLKTGLKDVNVTMTPLLAAYEQQKSNNQVLATMKDDIKNKVNKELFDHEQSSIYRQMDEILQQIHKLEADIVTRSDNETHWNGTAAEIAEVKQNIAALRLLIENMSGEGRMKAPAK